MPVGAVNMIRQPNEVAEGGVMTFRRMSNGTLDFMFRPGELSRRQAKALANAFRKQTSKWSEIRCEFYDYASEKFFVDAWEDDAEESKVIAKLDLENKSVEYLDPDAQTDPYAQEVISQMLATGHTEPDEHAEIA